MIEIQYISASLPQYYLEHVEIVEASDVISMSDSATQASKEERLFYL